MHVFVRVRGQRPPAGAIPIKPPTLLFETGFLTGWDLAWLDWPASEPQEIHMSLLPWHWDQKFMPSMPGFLCVFQGLSSDPQGCKTNTLLTGDLPHPGHHRFFICFIYCV